MNSKTFQSIEASRGCNEFGGYRLVRTETVHASGRVEWQVKGYSQDDGTINERGVREHGPLDLDKVEAARRASGWTVV
jgi:hypothetical protein